MGPRTSQPLAPFLTPCSLRFNPARGKQHRISPPYSPSLPFIFDTIPTSPPPGPPSVLHPPGPLASPSLCILPLLFLTFHPIFPPRCPGAFLHPQIRRVRIHPRAVKSHPTNPTPGESDVPGWGFNPRTGAFYYPPWGCRAGSTHTASAKPQSSRFAALKHPQFSLGAFLPQFPPPFFRARGSSAPSAAQPGEPEPQIPAWLISGMPNPARKSSARLPASWGRHFARGRAEAGTASGSDRRRGASPRHSREFQWRELRLKPPSQTQD